MAGKIFVLAPDPPAVGALLSWRPDLQESCDLVQRLHSSVSLDHDTKDALTSLGYLSLASWLSLAINVPPSESSCTESGALGSWSSVGERHSSQLGCRSA